MRSAIALIVDESGSMTSMYAEAKQAVIDFIKDQQKVKEPAQFTLVKFSDYYHIVADGEPLETIHADRFDYGPSSVTALFDAIGKTMNRIGERIQKDPVDKVIIAIITDGLENASKEFTLSDIKAMIEKAQANGWVLLYLAMGLEGFQQGMSMGVRLNTMAVTVPSVTGQSVSAYASASQVTSALRTETLTAGQVNLQKAYDGYEQLNVKPEDVLPNKKPDDKKAKLPPSNANS